MNFWDRIKPEHFTCDGCKLMRELYGKVLVRQQALERAVKREGVPVSSDETVMDISRAQAGEWIKRIERKLQNLSNPQFISSYYCMGVHFDVPDAEQLLIVLKALSR